MYVAEICLSSVYSVSYVSVDSVSLVLARCNVK